MSKSIREWIRNQKPFLEDIIVTAGQEFHEEHLLETTYAHHLRTARFESYGLSNGKDLCYDTPAIGLMYSLWYHPRRVNTCLSMIMDSLLGASGKSIDLFDLGSGSGAMQWACGLVYAAMRDQDLETPDLRIVSIDTSPFMMEYQRRLWGHFLEVYPVCKEIRSEYELNSWVNQREEYNPIWISASYLFDYSEKKGELRKAFRSITNQYMPERILLSSTLQKMPMVKEAMREFPEDEYVHVDVHSDFLLDGDLPKVTRVRHKLDEMLRLKQSRTTSWQEFNFVASVFKRKQGSLEFKRSSEAGLSRIDLFNPPITVRHDIQLAEDQIAAARHNNRPTVIYGPAGCGKSVVITERIKNLVEGDNYAPNFRILLTTFNKDLVQNLYVWLDDILDARFYRAEQPKKSEYRFYFRESANANIVLMHFDILPTRIGRLNGGIMHESIRERLIAELIDDVQEAMDQQGIKIERPERILNIEFIREEYERVFYGLSLRAEEDYLDGQRPGRPTLVRNQKPRQVAWWCMEKLDHAIKTSKHGVPFVNKRLRFHESLTSGANNNLFTHIFIDEFQDCTEADFEIFYSLLEDPNNIVAGGDLAQALHLGRSATLPRLSRSEQKNRDWKPLEGSYRLPFRISEALVNLSGRILQKRKSVGDMSDIGKIYPYKGSPPGARPIIIWAEDIEGLVGKAADVLHTYQVYDIDRVKVMETDNQFATALNRRFDDIKVGADSVLRIKGLETPCVIWSTRRPVLFKDEVEEFVYTILTRTAGLLIIALSPETCEMYKPILNTFEEDHLIFWDWESKKQFSNYADDVELSNDYEPYGPTDLGDL